MNIKISKILFTYSEALGNTGGIEKVNRTILKCLKCITDEHIKTEAWSLNDSTVDNNYFTPTNFRGFNKCKFNFVFNLIINARSWDKVIVGHINLAPAIRFMKIINPGIKIILIVHGIEVWSVLKSNKRWLLENADKIISVSNFTKDILISHSSVKEQHVDVLHNCLDYYFPKEFILEKPLYLLERYNIKYKVPILLTITRINKKERRKGYDNVIEVLHKIAESGKISEFKYLLCGKYENDEFERLIQKIDELNLSGKVILTGFIKEEELIDYYRLADIYIMPSNKEGFGIVFIEAAACGIKVIAGNGDGSADALMNGTMGQLVNPDSKDEIFTSILDVLKSPLPKSRDLADFTKNQFGFNQYKEQVLEIIKKL